MKKMMITPEQIQGAQKKADENSFDKDERPKWPLGVHKLMLVKFELDIFKGKNGEEIPVVEAQFNEKSEEYQPMTRRYYFDESDDKKYNDAVDYLLQFLWKAFKYTPKPGEINEVVDAAKKKLLKKSCNVAVKIRETLYRKDDAVFLVKHHEPYYYGLANEELSYNENKAVKLLTPSELDELNTYRESKGEAEHTGIGVAPNDDKAKVDGIFKVTDEDEMGFGDDSKEEDSATLANALDEDDPLDIKGTAKSTAKDAEEVPEDTQEDAPEEEDGTDEPPAPVAKEKAPAKKKAAAPSAKVEEEDDDSFFE
jgi:hypothetical protein